MPVASLHNQEELLHQIAEGNENAFETIYNYYRPVIFTTAAHLINEGWIAEEIVQDTFLKVWLKRAELPTVDNFPAWLYTIAVNLTYNALVKKESERRKKAKGESSSPNNPLTPSEWLQHKEYEEILEEAVKRLPEKQKQTYILIKKHGKSRGEAASELHVSPETVKWNLDRAMRSIRAYCMARVGDLNFLLLGLLICIKNIFS